MQYLKNIYIYFKYYLKKNLFYNIFNTLKTTSRSCILKLTVCSLTIAIKTSDSDSIGAQLYFLSMRHNQVQPTYCLSTITAAKVSKDFMEYSTDRCAKSKQQKHAFNNSLCEILHHCSRHEPHVSVKAAALHCDCRLLFVRKGPSASRFLVSP